MSSGGCIVLSLSHPLDSQPVYVHLRRLAGTRVQLWSASSVGDFGLGRTSSPQPSQSFPRRPSPSHVSDDRSSVSSLNSACTLTAPSLTGSNPIMAQDRFPFPLLQLPPITPDVDKELAAPRTASVSHPSTSLPRKSSLKAAHHRSRSAPSSPHHVRFDKKDSVRLFSRVASPSSLFEDDAQTTTGFPFPSWREGMLDTSYSPSAFGYFIDKKFSSRVPTSIPPFSPVVHDVRLESLFLAPVPLCLQGTVLVKNHAFVKQVSIRFSLDNWNTVSDVACRYAESLPLDGCDRFIFSLCLEDYTRLLSERYLWFAVKYVCPEKGEWWDNNDGQNYHVRFRRADSLDSKPAGRFLAPAVPQTPRQTTASQSSVSYDIDVLRDSSSESSGSDDAKPVASSSFSSSVRATSPISRQYSPSPSLPPLTPSTPQYQDFVNTWCFHSRDSSPGPRITVS